MEKDLIKSENKLAASYHRTRMQKEMVLQRLKENGCRITKQRKILLDIILQPFSFKRCSTTSFCILVL